MATKSARHRGLPDRIARKVVQIGFLALFLYPFLPVVFRRLTFKPVPMLTSWLLPWDPLLLLGHVLHRDWSVLVIGAPLLLLAATWLLGRSFCGWVCPIGTVLDLVRPLGLRTTRHPSSTDRGRRASANSPLRYYLLVLVLVGSMLSIQALGVLDPLVVFQRTATVLTSDAFALRQPAFRMYLSMSFLFLGILALELWRPRFWCRNLCPLGALLSLVSRWSLLNRQVSTACNGCGICRRQCAMHAIPDEAHDTSYTDCHLCLVCEGACPQGAISFRWGPLAQRVWRSEGRAKGPAGRARLAGRYVPKEERLMGLSLSRRGFAGGVAAGAAGLALMPALRATGVSRGVIRPPGALPEEEFLRTCIICQECVRVCSTGALKPTLLEAGLGGIGTPQLVPRQGGCSLNPSCPDLCAKVCPVGAIRPIRPDQMQMGLAKVDHTLCLAWDQGVKCLVCVEACATGAAQGHHGRVVVEPGRCTGCGRCEGACPVEGAAIHVYPRT